MFSGREAAGEGYHLKNNFVRYPSPGASHHPLPSGEGFSPKSFWSLPVLLVLAIGSGAAALIYEIVWFQLLELTLGSSAVSLAVILATFMGGTCLGSFILPRLVSSRRNPLRVYAAIEIGIGILALLVLALMPLAGRVYFAWSGYGLPGFLLRGLVAAACLLPPTLLMGATLPALARRVETTTTRASWLGFIYGANIAGAVIGCLLAGFYLLRVYDVTTATIAAVVINAAIAVAALVVASIDRQPPVPLETEAPESSEPRGNAIVYVAIGLSGLCALAAESIWTRMLSLLLGASVYTLSIILVVFLAGLGIGSGMGSLLSRSLERPRAALGWCQLFLAGAICWTAWSLAASLPYWPVNPSISSNIWFNFQLDLDRAFWALLPPTLLWGASFPLALASVDSKKKDGSRLFAGVYAANTLGAIIGALTASLILVAWIGSQHTQQLLIALSVIAGLLLLLSDRRAPSAVVLSVAAVLAGGLLIHSVPPISKLLIAHGRYASTWVGKGDIIFAEEGLNSFVAVSDFPNDVRTFHVAGKIQASNVPRDMRLQRMLGHLTSLTPVTPRSVLVIGCGAGITAGAVSIDPKVERLTIVEIEPLVPQTASKFFSDQNFDVIGSSKVQLHIDDGRHFLLTTKQKFDAITVDPLDPWVKGAANLYTWEFFDVAREHLNPGGVVTMYIQLFETNQAAVQSSIATFFEVFPNGTIWGNTYQGQGHDMVLLGQVEPILIDLDVMERRIEGNRIAQSLADIGMNSALDLFATYAGRRSDLTGWLRDAAINRDHNLRMQYLAGFGLNLDDSAAIYASMLANRKFPADLFASKEGRVDFLRAAIQERRP